MSFLTLGLNAKDPIIIDDGTTINTSFPGFVETMKSLGANLNFGDRGKARHLIVAIDGPAGSGKGTISKNSQNILILVISILGSCIVP